MPLAANCPACGKRHKAPDRLAGRTVSCLNCGQPFTLPAPDLDEAAAALLTSDEPAETPEPEARPARAYEPPDDRPPRPAPRRRPPHVATLPPLTTNDPPLWLRHLHWLLALALIPLAVSLLSGHDDEDDSIPARIEATLDRASPAERERFAAAISHGESIDDLLNALPDHRLIGAVLPRSTHWHWGLAALAAVLFLAFAAFLASDGSANPLAVLAVGLFTATAGVSFLSVVQFLAAASQGVIGGGPLMLVMAVLRFIAFSYDAATDPENGFLLSFFGFTLGVGLLEELVKSVPLFCHRRDRSADWRGLFIWGLATGAGFGIAEGILYSGHHYNGISGAGIYAVRFLSCVALHAIWSGSVAVTIYLKQHLFDDIRVWHDWIGPVLVVIAVPMVLHGLYDTCLKKDLAGAALAVAVLSFGYLAFLNSRLRGADDEEAKRAMLREYKRRRAAMA